MVWHTAATGRGRIRPRVHPGEVRLGAVRAGRRRHPPAGRNAHYAAVADVLAWLERHGAFTRGGRGGRLHVDTHGLVAACFDHYELLRSHTSRRDRVPSAPRDRPT